MDEIELKILEINRSAVLRKLKRLGAKKIFSGILQSTYFDFPGSRLHKKSQVLRLRQTGQKAFLTFKTRLPNQKTVFSEEIEFEVSNFGEASLFLKRLGFKPVLSYQKKRVSYRLGKTRIELEQYLGKFRKIKPFLEIEGHSGEALWKTLQKLGFPKKDARPWHTGRLMEHYGFKTL